MTHSTLAADEPGGCHREEQVELKDPHILNQLTLMATIWCGALSTSLIPLYTEP